MHPFGSPWYPFWVQYRPHLARNLSMGGGAHQELQGRKVKLSTAVYTSFIKACGSSPALVDAAHAAFKKMIWGPRRLKPNRVTFVTMVRVLREAGRPQDALDVYLGMRRAG